MAQIEEYIERILKALVYIEAHINDEMTMDDLAKVACYSVFHFHRIFQAIVGESVHRYIKRLRLEKAASRLRYTDVRITDIALDANYDTPSAFTKAFKQFMGESPANYRIQKNMAMLLADKIKELQMIKPDKIETISGLNLLFVRAFGSYTNSPKEAWKILELFIDENQLNRSKLRYFGIAHDGPEVTKEENLRYDACILVPEDVKQKGVVGKVSLQGGRYAAFSHLGAYEKLGETFSSIFLKWLPESSEVYDDDREPFCEYLNKEVVKNNPEKLITKIYIPLV